MLFKYSVHNYGYHSNYIVNTVPDFYYLFKIFKIANYKEMLQLDQCLPNLHHQIQSPGRKAILSLRM